jgi:hypothetical protein
MFMNSSMHAEFSSSQRGFAVGFRVGIRQKLINKIQYGSEWGALTVAGKVQRMLKIQCYLIHLLVWTMKARPVVGHYRFLLSLGKPIKPPFDECLSVSTLSLYVPWWSNCSSIQTQRSLC